ncbi:hypothetical protein [Caudoviricetes sp.]|nr:hypothetical protein [Caudoviricetes sp.]
MIELVEGFLLAFILGVVVLLGTATAIHTLEAPVSERGDLISPPPTLLCPDITNHCKAG